MLAADASIRGRIVLATKGGITPPVPYDSSAEYLAAACDASLRRLSTDVIDLYQIHRRDFLTHPQEVATALTRLVEAGKIRALGVSNYSPAELSALQRFLDLPIVSTQPEFSPVRAAPLYDGTLSWIMAHPARIIPIVGSQNAARIRAATGAVKVEWDRARWYAVLQAGTGEQLP